MPIFSKKRIQGVQSFILQLVNHNCPEVEAMRDGPRLEGRMNLVIPVLIIPVESGKIHTERSFTALSKEFSTSGLAVALDGPMGLDEVIIGFRWEQAMIFVRATARHLNPIGGGFFQLGFELIEMLHIGDHAELRSMSL